MTDLSKRLRARAAKLRRFGYSYGELSVKDLDEIADALEASRDAALTDAQIDAATAAWFHYSQEYANDDYRARMRAAIAAIAQTNEEPQ